MKEYPHFYEYYQEIEALREAYINYKLDHDLLDYDDLLVYLKLLLKNDSIRETLSERYKFIMVDEYQDTNKIQAEIVYLLGQRYKNVMVVGDDAQSIYGFRG
ncbi:MAG: ATP-dependent helicase, partial [Deltaproteobacteria bacterium]